MRKIALLLTVVILLSVPVNAYAATPWGIRADAELTFNGRTATYKGVAVPEHSSDYVVMRVTLWKGTMCLVEETVTGYGYLSYTDTITLTSGWEVELRVDVTINGTAYPTCSDIATCP